MKKVFILDDNEELLDIMQLLLSQEYEVQCSDGNSDIVPEINRFAPDLLILDHTLGDINSTDILGELKKQPGFSTPVILFSAHPLLADMAKLIGADGHIDKPSDIKYIREYVRNILAKQETAK